jgi:hypothetical protein
VTRGTYEQELFQTASRKYGLDEAILGFTGAGGAFKGGLGFGVFGLTGARPDAVGHGGWGFGVHARPFAQTQPPSHPLMPPRPRALPLPLHRPPPPGDNPENDAARIAQLLKQGAHALADDDGPGGGGGGGCGAEGGGGGGGGGGGAKGFATEDIEQVGGAAWGGARWVGVVALGGGR